MITICLVMGADGLCSLLSSPLIGTVPLYTVTELYNTLPSCHSLNMHYAASMWGLQGFDPMAIQRGTMAKWKRCSVHIALPHMQKVIPCLFVFFKKHCLIPRIEWHMETDGVLYFRGSFSPTQWLITPCYPWEEALPYLRKTDQCNWKGKVERCIWLLFIHGFVSPPGTQ